MVIRGISEMFNSVVESLLVMIYVQMNLFILQRVKIPLHRGIVIRASSFVHTLCYALLQTKFCECFIATETYL